MKTHKPKPILIVWTDACSSQAPWMELKDVEDFSTMEAMSYTIGFLIGETSKRYLLTPTINQSGASAVPWSIPKGIVRKMVPLGGRVPKLPELL